MDESVENCNDDDVKFFESLHNGKFKKNRQKNQHRPLEFPWELSEGAETLLALITKYRHRSNVKNQQYADLMGITRRNLVFYIRELEIKGRIEIFPKSKKAGQGKSNTYIPLEFN